ncbi:MAG: single-stranded DNA-binding protein [Phycisphaeraceae bacterium]
MAANYNKIVLMGNLTRDPQLSYLPSNTPVVEIGMAVNRRFKRQDGEPGEETLFVDCRAFGRTAEVINQYLSKGSPLFVEGRLQLDRWQDKEGNQRSKHRVFIENFQFMDSPQDRQNAGGGGGQPGGRSAPQGGGGYGGGGGGGYGGGSGGGGGGGPARRQPAPASGTRPRHERRRHPLLIKYTSA